MYIALQSKTKIKLNIGTCTKILSLSPCNNYFLTDRTEVMRFLYINVHVFIRWNVQWIHSETSMQPTWKSTPPKMTKCLNKKSRAFSRYDYGIICNCMWMGGNKSHLGELSARDGGRARGVFIVSDDIEPRFKEHPSIMSFALFHFVPPHLE